MGPPSSGDSLKAAVERQSGACRALAIAMRSHSEHAFALLPGERRIIADWATAIEGIADELVVAMAEEDLERVSRVSKLAKWAAIPLALLAGGAASGVGEGFGGPLAEEILGARVPVCAEEVVETSERVDEALASVPFHDQDLANGDASQPDARRDAAALSRAMSVWRSMPGLSKLRTEVDTGRRVISLSLDRYYNDPPSPDIVGQVDDEAAAIGYSVDWTGVLG